MTGANGASVKVLQVLVDAYPEGKTVQDKRLRTPLHFAFFRKDAKVDNKLDGAITNRGLSNQDEVGNSMTEIVRLLSDSGAAELQDEGGMVRRERFAFVRFRFILILGPRVHSECPILYSFQCTTPRHTVPPERSLRSSSRDTQARSAAGRTKGATPFTSRWSMPTAPVRRRSWDFCSRETRLISLTRTTTTAICRSTCLPWCVFVYQIFRSRCSAPVGANYCARIVWTYSWAFVRLSP